MNASPPSEAARTLPITEHRPPVPVVLEPPKALYAALVVAQKAAKNVGKDANNPHHNYKYASAEAVITEARGALGAGELAVMCLGWAFEPETTAAGAKAPPGEYGFYGELRVRYRLVHGSGESLDFETTTPVLPEKGRPQDKAEAIALTYSLAYFLRGLLLLPRDEEDGVDKRDDTNSRRAPREEPRREQRKAAPPASSSTKPAPEKPREPKPRPPDTRPPEEAKSFASMLDACLALPPEERAGRLETLIKAAANIHDLHDVANALHTATFTQAHRTYFGPLWTARAKELKEATEAAKTPTAAT